MSRESLIPVSLQWKYNIHWFFTHFFGFIQPLEQFFNRKRAEHSKQAIAYLQQQIDTEPLKIDMVTSDYEQALKKAVSECRPIVLRGAARDWPCCQKWSFDFFKQQYGQDKVPLSSMYIDAGGTYEEETLKASIERIEQGSSSYVRFASVVHDHADLQADLNPDYFKKFFPNKSTHFTAFQFFLGGKGSDTPVHCAPTSNFFIQVFGQKDWIVVDPYYNSIVNARVDRSPYYRSSKEFDYPLKDCPELLKKLPHYRFTLEPGDLFYNPPYYWHYVSNPTDSIGMSLKWTSVMATLRCSPMLFLLTFLSTNPTVLGGYVRAKFKRNHLIKWLQHG